MHWRFQARAETDGRLEGYDSVACNNYASTTAWEVLYQCFAEVPAASNAQASSVVKVWVDLLGSMRVQLLTELTFSLRKGGRSRRHKPKVVVVCVLKHDRTSSLKVRCTTQARGARSVKARYCRLNRALATGSMNCLALTRRNARQLQPPRVCLGFGFGRRLGLGPDGVTEKG